jgi:hypothetical protein
MALSDVLFTAERNILQYRNQQYDGLFPRIDEILCAIIKLRIELDTPPYRRPGGAFYIAARAGDIPAYIALQKEYDEIGHQAFWRKYAATLPEGEPDETPTDA